MSENQNNQDSYSTNDFSAVNQFIDDEKSFAQSFHSRIKSEYLRTALLYLSIVIVSIGLFLMFAAYAYHLYKSEKVIVEERIVTETSPDKKSDIPFDEIEKNKERDNLNQDLYSQESQVKKDYFIFSVNYFIDSNNISREVTTGNAFQKDEYDKPYSKFCYVYSAVLPNFRINLYDDGEKLFYNGTYKDYISYEDFYSAQSKCLMNEY
jgi:hypothetical protein